MNSILALLVGIIAFSSFMLVTRIIESNKRKKSLRERIDAGNTDYVDPEVTSVDMGGELSDQAKKMSRILRGMGVDVDKKTEAMELKFQRAGIISKSGPVVFLFAKWVGLFGGGLLGLLIFMSAGGDSKLLNRALGVLVGLMGVFGPGLWLKNGTDKRQKLLQRAFPDTLDLLLICVESGLSLDAALNRICSELAIAYPDMTNELNRTRLELTLLNDRVKALTNLGDRTGMVAFRSLVVALVQSERFGTSLVDTLRVLAEDFRLQRMQAAEAKAARLPVLMTIPLIFLLLPCIFMIILGPAIIGLMGAKDKVPTK